MILHRFFLFSSFVVGVNSKGRIEFMTSLLCVLIHQQANRSSNFYHLSKGKLLTQSESVGLDYSPVRYVTIGHNTNGVR